MGDQENKFIIYAENGTPIDTTTKNIEIATDDFLAKHQKHLKKANFIFRTISKKRTKYFRYMRYLEKKEKKYER